MYTHRLFDRGIPRIPLSDCRCTLCSYTGFLAIRCRRRALEESGRRTAGPGGYSVASRKNDEDVRISKTSLLSERERRA